MSATPVTPPPEARRAPASPEALERHWFEHVYAGDHVPQLTLRAVLMGTLIGCVMAFSNLYVGLKTGWGLNVAITACIISFTIFKLFHAVFPARGPKRTASSSGSSTGRTRARSRSSRTTACSPRPRRPATPPPPPWSRPSPPTSSSPASNVPFWTMAGLVLGTGLLGVFLAVPMKRTMINVEQLPFPSGTAAAETLRSLHGAGADVAEEGARPVHRHGAGGGHRLVPRRHPEPHPDLPAHLRSSPTTSASPRLAQLTSPSGYTLTVEASTVFAAARRHHGHPHGRLDGAGRDPQLRHPRARGSTTWASSRTSATAASSAGRSGAAPRS